MSLARSLRYVFTCAFAFTCTLTAFIPSSELGAQTGAAQRSAQAPTPTETSDTVPLSVYDHCDVAPGTDLETALKAIRALKERQAQGWRGKVAQPDGAGGVAPFQIDPNSPDRWGPLTDPYGTPEVITWSLAPDTALYFQIPPTPNQLFSLMNNQFGSPANWVWRIEAAFQRWSELTGITFVRVKSQGNEWDDGLDYGAPGAPGLRGDIRVFAAFIDGPFNGTTGGTLASAEPPAGIPPGGLGASPGEITFDLENWAFTTWNPLYGFQRAIHHEIGHAIGLAHTCPAQSNTKLMQPFASTQFGVPQHDDVRGAQALYGDPLEPNDSREQASFFQIYPFGGGAHPAATWPLPDSGVFPGGLLSIDNGSDVDWFEFGLLHGASMNVVLRPIGGLYPDWPTAPILCPSSGGSVNSALATPLRLQLWRSIDANDDVMIAEALTLAGAPAQLPGVLLKYPGRYRIRVASANGTTLSKQSQQYELEVSWSPQGCSGSAYCNDSNAQNGIETCDFQGGCIFEYVDDDYNFNSVPDVNEALMQIDCDSNGHADLGETVYSTNGQPRTRVRGQDECGDAQPIAAGIDYSYMTYYASPDPGIQADSKDEAGVWFSYTPQTNGVVTVQVRSHLEFPTELYVAPLLQSGSCASSSSSFCASGIEWSTFGEPLGQLAVQTFQGRANVEHRIRVSGNFQNVYQIAGDFTIRVEGPDDVTNDCDKNGFIDVCQSAPDCNGNGIIDSCELVGATNHCLLSANASGPGAIISAAGTLSVAARDLVLVAEGANPGVNGIFIASTSRLPLPQEGKICLAGPVLRLGAEQVGADGVAVMRIDFTQFPQLTAGSTWNFQFWFRDNGGPGIGYVGANVSDAIELKLCQ